MFCKKCGKEFAEAVKFCSECGTPLTDETRCTNITTISTPTPLLSFDDFRKEKSRQRQKLFKGKKGVNNKESIADKRRVKDTTIAIGILNYVDDTFRPERGSMIPLKINVNDDAASVKVKAFDKLSRYCTSFPFVSIYQCRLSYKSGETVVFIPGTRIPFTVMAYKEDMGCTYARICLYLTSKGEESKEDLLLGMSCEDSISLDNGLSDFNLIQSIPDIGTPSCSTPRIRVQGCTSASGIGISCFSSVPRLTMPSVTSHNRPSSSSSASPCYSSARTFPSSSSVNASSVPYSSAIEIPNFPMAYSTSTSSSFVTSVPYSSAIDIPNVTLAYSRSTSSSLNVTSVPPCYSYSDEITNFPLPYSRSTRPSVNVPIVPHSSSEIGIPAFASSSSGNVLNCIEIPDDAGHDPFIQSSQSSALQEPETIITLPQRNLKEALENHFHCGDILNLDITDRVVLSIRRRNLWKDTVSKLKRNADKIVSKPLRIDFIGEDGDDFGGLTREFFSEVFQAAAHNILQGSPNNLSPIHDVVKLQHKEYFIYGQLIALALKHGCPGPRNICISVAEKILDNANENIVPLVQDIPCFDLQQRLQEIMNAPGEEVKEMMSKLGERFDAGLPEFKVDIPKEDFCNIISHRRVIDLNINEIKQISDGIAYFQILELLQKYKADALAELVYQGSLTAEDIRSLLDIQYSDEEGTKAIEEDIIYNFIGFLEGLEDKQFIEASYYDPCENQVVIKQIKLEDILQFLTGSRQVFSTIRHKKIKVYFDNKAMKCTALQIGVGLISNTCEMSLTFPTSVKFSDGEVFSQNFIDFMMNTPGFTKV